MKSGKIILGAVAAVVTVGSSLAFKVAHKFNDHPVFVKVTAGGKCLQCTKLFTAAGGIVTNTKCNTSGGASVRGTGTSHITFFTKQTNGGVKCTNTHRINKTTATH